MPSGQLSWAQGRAVPGSGTASWSAVPMTPPTTQASPQGAVLTQATMAELLSPPGSFPSHREPATHARTPPSLPCPRWEGLCPKGKAQPDAHTGTSRLPGTTEHLSKALTATLTTTWPLQGLGRFLFRPGKGKCLKHSQGAQSSDRKERGPGREPLISCLEALGEERPGDKMAKMFRNSQVGRKCWCWGESFRG